MSSQGLLLRAAQNPTRTTRFLSRSYSLSRGFRLPKNILTIDKAHKKLIATSLMYYFLANMDELYIFLVIWNFVVPWHLKKSVILFILFSSKTQCNPVNHRKYNRDVSSSFERFTLILVCIESNPCLLKIFVTL